MRIYTAAQPSAISSCASRIRLAARAISASRAAFRQVCAAFAPVSASTRRRPRCLLNIELRVAPTRTTIAILHGRVTAETTIAALKDKAAALDDEWSADGITLIRDGRHIDDVATVARAEPLAILWS